MFFGKVPWDIYCNMDGISDGRQLCTLRFTSVTTTFAVEHTSNAVILCGLYGRFRRQGNLEYEVRVFLKGGRPPPPLQTHPHTHTMHEKRRYNGALCILAVFRGRASLLLLHFAIYIYCIVVLVCKRHCDNMRLIGKYDV